jgi:hypothetical protein
VAGGVKVVCGSAVEHARLVNAILAECGAMSGVVLGLNATGRARYLNERTGRAYVVPYGFPGPVAPDLLAAIAPHGKLLGLEAKTGDATTTPAQRAVHEALRAVGVAVHVVRSVAEARAAITAALGAHR